MHIMPMPLLIQTVASDSRQHCALAAHECRSVPARPMTALGGLEGVSSVGTPEYQGMRETIMPWTQAQASQLHTTCAMRLTRRGILDRCPGVRLDRSKVQGNVGKASCGG